MSTHESRREFQSGKSGYKVTPHLDSDPNCIVFAYSRREFQSGNDRDLDIRSDRKSGQESLQG